MSTRRSSSSGMQRLRQPCRARWQMLSPRDRIALQVLAVFAAGVGFWWGAWTPVRAHLQSAQANVVAEQQMQAYLRSNAPRLAASAQVASRLKPEQVPALLASSADKHGLVLVQAQQRPDQRFSVALEGAPAEVVGWLQELQSAGVSVAELTMAQAPDGRWNSDLVLAGPET